MHTPARPALSPALALILGGLLALAGCSKAGDEAPASATAAAKAGNAGSSGNADKPTPGAEAPTARGNNKAPDDADKPAGEAVAPKPRAQTGDPRLPGYVRPVGPVALVNGQPIPADRFNEDFDRLVGTGVKVPADRVKHIARNVLNRLVDSELRAQAIRRENITLTDTEFGRALDAEMARFRTQSGKLDETRLTRFLDRNQQSRERFEQLVRERALTRKLVEKLGRVRVTDAEIKAFYDANPKAWVAPESRDVRPIVFRVPTNGDEATLKKAEQEATAAAEALRKGEDFETVSARYNETPLEPIHLIRGSKERELVKVAFKLRLGEVSDPVRTRWGYYVLRLVDKSERRSRSFEEVRVEIRDNLRERKRYIEDRKLVQELRKTATIEEKLPF
jgi:parvulin-like peptidyl-prolyl isomerase